MTRRCLSAVGGLALLATPAVAGTHDIGKVSMYLCDNGLDLCSDGLNFDYNITLGPGPFSEIFLFDVVSPYINVPDNWPLVKTNVFLGYSAADFYGSDVVFYYPTGGVGIALPSPSPNEFINWAVTPYATGYSLEATGYSNVASLSVQGSLSAFDLGPVIPIVPEPSTWAMLGIGFASLALAASSRTASARRGAVRNGASRIRDARGARQPNRREATFPLPCRLRDAHIF